MRSEERAGVIAAILLFTWGTLVTEPLHIFTEFIFDVLMTVGHKLGMASGGRMIMITATVAMAVISLLLMLMIFMKKVKVLFTRSLFLILSVR